MANNVRLFVITHVCIEVGMVVGAWVIVVSHIISALSGILKSHNSI